MVSSFPVLTYKKKIESGDETRREYENTDLYLIIWLNFR